MYIHKQFYLRGIEEVPESFESTERKSTTAPEETATPTSAPVVAEPEGEPEYYIANYPYQSQEQGDLTFNAGDVIGVIKKEGDWWTGKIGTTIGIFPSNYVQKVDVVSFKFSKHMSFLGFLTNVAVILYLLIWYRYFKRLKRRLIIFILSMLIIVSKFVPCQS